GPGHGARHHPRPQGPCRSALQGRTRFRISYYPAPPQRGRGPSSCRGCRLRAIRPAVTKRILLVEDDQAIAVGVALNLKIAGYAVTVASDGEAALDAIAAHKPDLILLDINLPKKDGIALMAELRRAGDRT